MKHHRKSNSNSISPDKLSLLYVKEASMTYKNHLDDKIILIGTLKSVVLWMKK